MAANTLTLYQIRMQVEAAVDDEWDEDLNYAYAINDTIMKINSDIGTIFQLLELDDVTIEAALGQDSLEPYSTYIDIPTYGLNALVEGLKTKLLKTESEDDRWAQENLFDLAIAQLDFRLPLDAPQRDPEGDTNTYYIKGE